MPIAEAIPTKYGHWTLLYHGGPGITPSEQRFVARCVCGAEKEVSIRSLRRGKSTSCGCGRVKKPAIKEGDRIGRWTFGKFIRHTPKGYIYEATCDCGTVKEVNEYSVRVGHSVSCGCYRDEQSKQRFTTHGKCNSKVYSIYNNMMGRCYNENNKSYEYYGGKGIGVCDRWRESFEAFLANMGEPGEGMEIDRLDNSKDYSPDNCKWSTRIEQILNRDCTIRIEFRNEKLTLTEVSDRTGIDRRTLYQRYLRGWSPEEIVRIPLLPTRVRPTLESLNDNDSPPTRSGD